MFWDEIEKDNDKIYYKNPGFYFLNILMKLYSYIYLNIHRYICTYNVHNRW